MVQNHLLQLLCLIAMEPPAQWERDAVRDEKLKVLRALRPWTDASISGDVVRGQYAGGVADGVRMSPYVDEIRGEHSDTETFVALRTYVDNWRWSGVPFYLSTGKRMGQHVPEIVVHFKSVPHEMFAGAASTPNSLVIRVQPDEAVRLHLTVKEPGPGGIRFKPVSLDLSYAETFTSRMPDAYERLLMDVVRGNPTLFMRRDEVESAWTWVEPILHRWRVHGRPALYAAGADGPDAADSLLHRDGRTWHGKVPT